MEALVVVVGSGLIGAAAARYCAESGATVTLVGPCEPADLASASGPFSSHYDEGRLTRITDNDPVWAEWARQSIGRYSDIEERSGIKFYTARPLVYVTPTADENLAVAQSGGSRVSRVEASWVCSEFGLKIPDRFEDSIIYEESPAGYINPRLLVGAQRKLAELAGATLVDGTVLDVCGVEPGLRVELADGTSLSADRVILATGAYGAELAGVRLDLERRLRTVALLETDEMLPGLIVNSLNRPGLDSLYWVPPVKYPDGRTYLKVGGDATPTKIAESNDEIDAWFHSGGSASEASDLVSAVVDLLPDLEFGHIEHKPCVVAGTPSGRPYLESLENGLIVAIGGSGSAAKSSDEIGRQASLLV